MVGALLIWTELTNGRGTLSLTISGENALMVRNRVHLGCKMSFVGRELMGDHCFDPEF